MLWLLPLAEHVASGVSLPLPRARVWRAGLVLPIFPLANENLSSSEILVSLERMQKHCWRWEINCLTSEVAMRCLVSNSPQDSVLGVTRRGPRKHRKQPKPGTEPCMQPPHLKRRLHLPLRAISTRPTTLVGFLPCCSRAGPLPASFLGPPPLSL